jgi:hypothetical protein
VRCPDQETQPIDTDGFFLPFFIFSVLLFFLTVLLFGFYKFLKYVQTQRRLATVEVIENYERERQRERFDTERQLIGPRLPVGLVGGDGQTISFTRENQENVTLTQQEFAVLIQNFSN